jgi:serine/threonine-protein kinase HipA
VEAVPVDDESIERHLLSVVNPDKFGAAADPDDDFRISLAGGAFKLTKLYDVMSAYPILGSGPNQWSPHDVKMAMALLGKNRHYQMATIQRRHFNSTAQKVGYGHDAEAVIQRLIARTPGAISAVQAQLPKDFSPWVAERVLGGLQQAVATLEGMPST